MFPAGLVSSGLETSFRFEQKEQRALDSLPAIPKASAPAEDEPPDRLRSALEMHASQMKTFGPAISLAA